MESDLDDMRRKLDMAEGSKSALQQQVCIIISGEGYCFGTVCASVRLEPGLGNQWVEFYET